MIEDLRLVTADLEERFNGGRSAFELTARFGEIEISAVRLYTARKSKDGSPTTVVTEVDALDTVLDAQRRILGALNPLNDDGQLIVRDLANPSDIIPVELRVDVAEHGGSERGGGGGGRRGGGAVGANRGR